MEGQTRKPERRWLRWVWPLLFALVFFPFHRGESLFWSLVRIPVAYSNGRGLATVPAMETIASVDLALRKRDGGNEWTRVEGVPRKDWEELLGYFRASPYRDLTLKWQIWGEVRVNVRAGEPLVFQVFHTGDEVGAYKCGGYGQIGDEAAFAATAQRICAESRDH